MAAEKKPPVRTLESVEEVLEELKSHKYVASRPLATALFLSMQMRKPILLEGEAGVGKTQLARTLAEVLRCNMIRLQCFDGLDHAAAVYEWDYARQLLEIRLAEAQDRTDQLDGDLYDKRFLLARPLLNSLLDENQQILLIDEIDRADEPFEAFLLEFLADFQISIPEYGTVKAVNPPIVVITSNRTRELHDALKRRCLYHWVEFPSVEQEREILQLRAADAAETLRQQMVAFVHELRNLDLYKIPGVAETLDWASALVSLNVKTLDEQAVDQTLGVLLKYQDDIDRLRGEQASSILAKLADSD